MALPIPVLDDRRFLPLVEGVRVRIPSDAPSWTDHNVHDPGITLLELFAWLAEMQIFYLDRSPAAHEGKFLRLLGITPRPATPARVAVTFDAPTPTTIPAGTTLLVPRTATRDEIAFATDQAIDVQPITIERVLRRDASGVRDETRANEQEELYFAAFGDAAIGATLYVGLDMADELIDDLLLAGASTSRLLTAALSVYDGDLPPVGGHDDEWVRTSLTPSPDDVPRTSCGCPLEAPALAGDEIPFHPSATVVWEYAARDGSWRSTSPAGATLLVVDGTRALSWSGTVTFALSGDLGRRRVPACDRDLYWLRCRVLASGYEVPPRLESIRVNTIHATQGRLRLGDRVGISTGLPGQQLRLREAPVRAGSAVVTVARSEQDPQPESWSEVTDLDASGPDDRHYTLEPASGVLAFGDGRHGRVPPSGSVVLVDHRTGGGVVGNVAPGAISRCEAGSAVRVHNPEPATGGRAAETLVSARRRALLDLRTPYQAVTSADFELLARATPALRVARAKALPLVEPPRFDATVPGAVTVAVVPFAFDVKPTPSPGFLRTVCEHLDRHRLITTRVRVIAPDYVEVAVGATILMQPGSAADAVRQRVVAALDTFLHPLRGGVGGAGWEFGRSVFHSEIFQVIEAVPGVDCVSRIALSARGAFLLRDGDVVLLRPHALVHPGAHVLELIDPAQRCQPIGPCHAQQQ